MAASRASYDTLLISRSPTREVASKARIAMFGPRLRRAAPSPVRDRQHGVRHALLRTLPGRAIVVGLGIRLVVYALGLLLGTVPPFLAVIDTVAGVALAAGATYFVYQLVIIAKRR